MGGQPADTRATLPSFSIVLETENLASADLDGFSRGLATLARQDPSPACANEVLLLESGDVPAEVLARLRAEYPWVSVRRVDADAGYYAAKMQGVSLATGDVVVFADSDCLYAPGWLRSMLEPFERDPGVHVVAGETTTAIAGPYSIAMALTYIFPPLSGGTGLRPGSGYFLNNVAFRRDLLLRHSIPTDLPLYRGHCVVHASILRSEGYTIWRQAAARASHAPPEGLAHFVWRFLLLGEDAPATARLAAAASRRRRGVAGSGRRALAPFGMLFGRPRELVARAGRIFGEDPRRLAYLPVVVPVSGASAVLFLLGFGGGLVRPGFFRTQLSRLHAL